MQEHKECRFLKEEEETPRMLLRVRRIGTEELPELVPLGIQQGAAGARGAAIGFDQQTNKGA